jgi:hypothetical protein
MVTPGFVIVLSLNAAFPGCRGEQSYGFPAKFSSGSGEGQYQDWKTWGVCFFFKAPRSLRL